VKWSLKVLKGKNKVIDWREIIRDSRADIVAAQYLKKNRLYK